MLPGGAELLDILMSQFLRTDIRATCGAAGFCPHLDSALSTAFDGQANSWLAYAYLLQASSLIKKR